MTYYILIIILITYQYIAVGPVGVLIQKNRNGFENHQNRPLKLLRVNVKLTSIKLTLLTVNGQDLFCQHNLNPMIVVKIKKC